MKKLQLFFKTLLLPADFLICILSFFIAFESRIEMQSFFFFRLYPGFVPPFQEYLYFVFYTAFLLIIVFFVGGLYEFNMYKRGLDLVSKMFFLSIVWMFLISSFFFWSRTFFFSRLVLLVGVFLTVVLVVLMRIVLDWIKDVNFLKKYFQKNAVVLGLGNLNNTIISALEKDKEYVVIKNINQIEELRLSKIKESILHLKIDTIIQTDVGRDLDFDLKLLDYCQLNNIRYIFTPTLFSLHKANIETRVFSNIPLIELKQTPLDGWGKVIKRIFDIVFSLMVLIFLIPIFLIISLLVKITSEGPVFVFLDRVKYKEIFRIVKFRSMINNAHVLKQNLLKNNERKDGPLFKIKDDPRITPLGRFLRKSRMDELPQFWNVLKGEMSVVGPRPHEPEEVSKYQKHHRKLLTIKPGITGMAQTEGASDLPFEEEVNLDTYYIENWNVWLDIKIVLKTVVVVFKGKGAC